MLFICFPNMIFKDNTRLTQRLNKQLFVSLIKGTSHHGAPSQSSGCHTM